MVRSQPQASTPNATCHPLHRWPYLGREEHNESGSVAGAHRGLSELTEFARFPDRVRILQCAGTVGLRRSERFLMAYPHPDDIGLDRCRCASLWSSWAENATDPCTLFSETPQSQRSRHRSTWTGPIAAPATPEAPFVLGRRNRQTPASHLSVVDTWFLIATDSLLDHRIARQHGAPCRRSDRSNGRRCSLRFRSSPTSYP